MVLFGLWLSGMYSVSESENEVLFLWVDNFLHGVRTDNCTYDVSGFCHNVVDAFTLLGCNTVQVGGWLPTFWESLLDA